MKRMTRREALFAVAGVAGTVYSANAQQSIKVEVYKDPTCGCCGLWVAHLRARGFAPTVTDTPNMTQVKDRSHIPAQLRSCHTALVGGYVIEGHVPAADVQRLLTEKPKVLGLAVPGMPVGSPGMEGPGGRPYDVVTFDAAGKTTVYSTQQPSSRA
jgi:hypothetical protein